MPEVAHLVTIVLYIRSYYLEHLIVCFNSIICYCFIKRQKMVDIDLFVCEVCKDPFSVAEIIGHSYDCRALVLLKRRHDLKEMPNRDRILKVMRQPYPNEIHPPLSLSW